MLRTLLANTNAYGAKKQKGKRGAWRNITISDMFSFLALVIYMGLVKCSTLVDFWKGSRLYSLPFPSSVMSRKKFFTICCALHISDTKADEENDTKRGTSGYNRLGKTKPLYNQIVESCKSHFQPGQHISIDERMVASKARTSITQYIPVKPTKWGYKLFVPADSNCGYTLNLFLDLLKKRIGACGTVCSDRVCFPKTQANDFTRVSPRGTIFWIRDSKVLFVKWPKRSSCIPTSTRPSMVILSKGE